MLCSITIKQPFGHPKPDWNPSWDAVKPLAGSSTVIVVDGVELECQFRSTLLPVEYQPVRNMLKYIHHASYPTPDIIIHVGLAGASDIIRIESLGRCETYAYPDNAGYVPECGQCDGYAWPQREPKFNPEALVSYLHARGWQGKVEKSTNAGLYLCEYTYYASMCEAERSETCPWVAFVHVPWPGEIFTVEELTQVVREVATWMASEKWIQCNKAEIG